MDAGPELPMALGTVHSWEPLVVAWRTRREEDRLNTL